MPAIFAGIFVYRRSVINNPLTIKNELTIIKNYHQEHFEFSCAKNFKIIMA